TAEDVDEDPFHVGIGDDDLEGCRNLFFGSAAADIEKIRRLATKELDDVHRRHGEPGSVHHTADRAVELDVGEFVPGRLALHRIFLIRVAQLLDVLVTVERVVVEIDLGIETNDLAVLRHYQRVDLEQ